MIAAFMVAVAFGAMLVHQRVTDVEKWMLLIVLLFGGCGYLGLVLANSYFAFLSPSWLSGFWSTCTIIFITAAVVGYHPYYGFFGRKDVRIWASMLGLFFLTGALVNVWFSQILTFILLLIIFVIGMFAGFYLQNLLSLQWSRFRYLPYVPLVFLVFATAGKLL